MDAPISAQAVISVALRDAIDAANGWRGRCVNLFARAERALGEALLSFEPGKKPPMLASQKADRLQKLHAPDSAASILDEFARLLVDRAPLAHGVGKVWIDDTKSWLLRLDWLSGTDWRQRAFTADEAKAFHAQLRAVVQQLERVLKVSA